MARPVRNPAGLESAPTHTHPLSARANGCMRTRIPIEEGAEEPRRARFKAHFISNRRRRTMTVQTVALSSLEPGRGNPRRAMDRNGLEGLAASIRNDGLLQNLVVRPVNGKGEHYRIIAGGRRYRALKLLEERGEV